MKNYSFNILPCFQDFYGKQPNHKSTGVNASIYYKELCAHITKLQFLIGKHTVRRTSSVPVCTRLDVIAEQDFLFHGNRSSIGQLMNDLSLFLIDIEDSYSKFIMFVDTLVVC